MLNVQDCCFVNMHAKEMKTKKGLELQVSSCTQHVFYFRFDRSKSS